MAFNSGSIIFGKSSGFSIIDKHFDTFGADYQLVFSTDNVLLPYIHCSNCEKFWQLYKLYNGLVRSNPRSNIVNHNCSKATNQPTLNQLSLTELDNYSRSECSSQFAKIIAKYPTISTNSGVMLANDIANFVGQFSIKKKKTFNFNISRQLVSKEIKEIAIEKASANFSIFKENFEFSSIVADHWSAHGRNFFAIIARIFLPDFQIKEFLLHFGEANADKSAKGKIFVIK